MANHLEKGFHKELEATMVVEASIIMPIVFAVILFLIFTTFRLHDYAVLCAAAAEKAVSSVEWAEGEAPVPDVQLFYYRELDWGGEEETRKGFGGVSRNRKIYYSSEGENEHIERLVNGLLGMGGQRVFSLEESNEWTEYIPSDFIWTCQIFLDGSEK